MTSNTIYNVTLIQSKIMSDFKSEVENFFHETISELELRMENGIQSYDLYDCKLKNLFSKYEDCINYNNPDSSYILNSIKKIILLDQKVFSDYKIFYQNRDVSQLISTLNLRYYIDVVNDIKRYIQDMDVDAFIEDYF